MSSPLAEDLYRAGAAAWPSLPIEQAAFETYLLALPEAARPSSLVHAADLYLACGCALAREDALTEFESRFERVLASAVARIDRSPDFVEDAVQSLRIKLFVRRPPKIAAYGGRAKLSTWLTTLAVRGALDHRDARGERPADERILDALEASVSPELDYLRGRYKREFEGALQVALARLEQKDRGLLRLHLGERMSIDRLAIAYGVGRSTAARWLAAARDALVEHTERELRERLGTTASEVRDLGKALRSQLEVSFLRLLGSPGN